MTGPWVTSEASDAITVFVVVAPRASRARIGPVVGDRLELAITASPVDGKANAAVIELLAKALKVAKSAVSIVAGERGKRKTLRIRGADAAVLRRLIEEQA